MAGGTVTGAKLNLLLAVLAVAAVPLASCSHITVPKREAVPTAIACVDLADRPGKPLEAMRPEAELRALDDYKIIPRLRADRLALIQHVDRLEAIVDGCSHIPQQ